MFWQVTSFCVVLCVLKYLFMGRSILSATPPDWATPEVLKIILSMGYLKQKVSPGAGDSRNSLVTSSAAIVTTHITRC